MSFPSSPTAPISGSLPRPPSKKIVLPPPPPVDVTYPATSDYFWGTLERNTTVAPNGGSFETANGPFGFATSVVLPGDSCMVQKQFARTGDSCVSDPSNCADGMSFSMWERTVYNEDVFEERDDLQLRYLLSTAPVALSIGGDVQGSPGVAVYLQGMTLGAVVSTGSKYWRVETVGLMPNNTWNNIGVRWRAPVDGVASDFVGLQLYVNQKLAGATVHGVTPSVIAKPPLSPPEFMVGCHKSSGETEYRHFCPCEFDELAMWRRALKKNETLFFLGGYEANFSNVSPEDFVEMITNVDLTDPQQQMAAVSLANKLAEDRRLEEAEEERQRRQRQRQEEEEAEQVAEEEEEEEEEYIEPQPPGPTRSPPPVASRSQVMKMKTMRDILIEMTLPEAIKANQTEDELESFMGLVYLASNLLQEKNAARWGTIEVENKKRAAIALSEQKKSDKKLPPPVLEKEASDMVNTLEEWVLNSLDQIVYPENNSEPTVSVVKKSPKIDMYAAQMSLENFRSRQTSMYPSDVLRKLDSLEVPTTTFRKPGCEEAMVSTVFSKYDSYGALSPKRFSSRKFETKYAQYLELDSAVLSLRVRILLDQVETERCLPTTDDLRESPIRVAFRHKTPAPTVREPLFHHDEVVSDVLRRHCVWWNLAEKGGKGAWDPSGCVVLASDEFSTRCACKTIGQYAVVAEQVEPKLVDIDGAWLKLIKTVFHVTSAFLLFVYAIVVYRSTQLWEMFHQMRMVTALLLMFGNMFMCLADLESVRVSRHDCTAVAAFQQLCYLAAGLMVTSEGHANFKALTAGVIGGKVRSYCALSAGISMMCLGYALSTDLHRYGDDPQCMLGWETDVKLVFFAPMLLSLVLTLVSALLIVLNQSTPQLRKESLIADQATICIGYCWFCLYFVVTWTAGLLAYVRFEELEGMPSFYPLFQFMNAACGLIFFTCLGMMSRRFRMVIMCRGQERRRLLVAYNVHEDDVEEDAGTEEPRKDQEEDEEEEDSSSEGEEDDSEDGDDVPLVNSGDSATLDDENKSAKKLTDEEEGAAVGSGQDSSSN